MRISLDLGAFLATTAEPEAVIARLREHCAGMTLFLLVRDDHLVGDIPLRIVFNGPSATLESGTEEEDEAAMPPPTRQRNGIETMEARS